MNTLFTAASIRLRKTVPSVLKTSLARWARTVFKTTGTVFLMRTSQPMNNIYIFSNRALMFGFPPVTPIEPGSHHRHFTKGELVLFSEPKTTQFKMLKAEPEKKITFADRLVGKGNKFSHYVSAFANFAGGHMYCGIKDDGEVEGEFIDEKEKKKVKVRIHNAIEKMLWPKTSEPADRNEDKRWDVHFVPVRDSETDNVVPSLYVVVVFIAQCRGGVFTEGAECYEIVDNQVQKVDFVGSWKKRIDPRLTEEG